MSEGQIPPKRMPPRDDLTGFRMITEKFQPHFGIWLGKEERWLFFENGNLFFTTSYVVAQAQLQFMLELWFRGREDVVIRSFETLEMAPEGWKYG